MPNAIASDTVLASGNAGKIREFGAMLAPLGITLIPQAELGVSQAEETGLSFIENALIKARHATARTRLPAIADDSGLEVEALHGAPAFIPPDTPVPMPMTRTICACCCEISPPVTATTPPPVSAAPSSI